MNYVATMSLWYFKAGKVGWAYAAIDTATMLYFVRRWSEPNAQHRMFHYILMSASIVAVSFSAFQWLFKGVYPDVATFSARWYQLIVNLTFMFQLTVVSVYALLQRRAKANPKQWRKDTERWLDKNKDKEED